MQINQCPQLKPQSYLSNYTWILKSSLWPDPVHTDYLETKIARIRPVSAERIKDTHTNTQTLRPFINRLCAKIGSRVWAVAVLKNIKKSQYPYMLPHMASRPLIGHRTRTNFIRVGDLLNVITHAKLEINWYKIVPLAKGWSFMFQHYYSGRH